MGQDPAEVAKAYDAVAREYAEAFADEHEKKPGDREVLRRFAAEVGDRGPVWDLGCGPGQTTGFLKGLGVTVSGLDLSEGMLEQARARHPGIPFRKGSLLRLELPGDSIAGAVAFYAIVHFTEAQVRQACLEVFRVLRPGGLFLLTFHIGDGTIRIEEFLGKRVEVDFTFFTTTFISGCLESGGFEGIEIVERDPYPGVEYESRRAYVFARKPLCSPLHGRLRRGGDGGPARVRGLFGRLRRGGRDAGRAGRRLLAHRLQGELPSLQVVPVHLRRLGGLDRLGGVAVIVVPAHGRFVK